MRKRIILPGVPISKFEYLEDGLGRAERRSGRADLGDFCFTVQSTISQQLDLKLGVLGLASRPTEVCTSFAGRLAFVYNLDVELHAFESNGFPDHTAFFGVRRCHDLQHGVLGDR